MKNILLNKLSSIRQDLGYTQEVLSEISGISVRTIQRIESGKEASFESAKCLASSLDLVNYHELSDSVSSFESHSEQSIIKNTDYEFITKEKYLEAYKGKKHFRLVKSISDKAYVPIIFIFIFIQIILQDNVPISSLTSALVMFKLIVFIGTVLLLICAVHCFYKFYLNPTTNKLMRLGVDVSDQELSSRVLQKERFNQVQNVSLFMTNTIDELPELAKVGDAKALAILGLMLCEGRFIEQNITLGLDHLSIAAKQGSAYAAYYIARLVDTEMVDHVKGAQYWYGKAGELGIVNTHTMLALRRTVIS